MRRRVKVTKWRKWKTPRIHSFRVTGGRLFGGFNLVKLPRTHHAGLDPATAFSSTIEAQADSG